MRSREENTRVNKPQHTQLSELFFLDKKRKTILSNYAIGNILQFTAGVDELRKTRKSFFLQAYI